MPIRHRGCRASALLSVVLPIFIAVTMLVLTLPTGPALGSRPALPQDTHGVTTHAGSIPSRTLVNRPVPSGSEDLLAQALPSPGSPPSCVKTNTSYGDPKIDLDHAVVQDNLFGGLWNGTSGELGTCYGTTGSAPDPGSVFSYVNFTMPAGEGWFSYPETTYGAIYQWAPPMVYSNMTPAFEMPQLISNLTAMNLWTTVSYNITPPSPAAQAAGVWYDISFDDWVTQNTTWVIEYPETSIEIMVWLGHTIPNSGTAWSMPTLVNGTMATEPWYVNPYCTSAHALTIDFEYAGNQSGTTIGLTEGTFGINMTAIYDEVATVLPNQSCWKGPTNFYSLYMQTFDFGSEEGQGTATSIHYWWNTTSLCFEDVHGPPSAGDLACAQPPAPRYATTFSESGLPSGTPWTVHINGTTDSAVAPSPIVVDLINGSYPYTVGPVAGYQASPPAGTMVVQGGPTGVNVSFAAEGAPSYNVSFSETGLPKGTFWSVTMNGTTKSSTENLVFTEPNGTYPFTVGAMSGYTALPSSGSVTINGAPKAVSITFFRPSTGANYTVFFSENGLPLGTSWFVTLNGQTLSSTQRTITFNEANGSYGFTVGSVSGYTVNPSSGSVKVNGAPVFQTITFTSSTPPGKTNQTTGLLGLPGYDGDILVGGIVAAAVAAIVTLVLWKGRKYQGTPGY